MKSIALVAAVLLCSSSAFGQGSPGDNLTQKSGEVVRLVNDCYAAGPTTLQTERTLAFFYAAFATSQLQVAQATPGWQPVIDIDFKFSVSPPLMRRTTSDPIYNTLAVGRYYLNRSTGSAANFNPYRTEQILPY